MSPHAHLAKEDSSHESFHNLKGTWDTLLKVALVVIPIFIPVILAWGVWTTSQIFSIQSDNKLNQQVVTQLSANSSVLAQHEKSLTELNEINSRGNRFTAEMAESQRLRIMQDVNLMVGERIESLRKDMTGVQISLVRLTLLIEQQRGISEKNSAVGKDSFSLPNIP